MSDSNVGGRKGKTNINHIFVENSVIHKTLSFKKNKSVTLKLLDFLSCVYF